MKKLYIDRLKKWIDNASYDQLLYKWRYAPSDDPIFDSEIKEYYRKILFERKSIKQKTVVKEIKNYCC